MIRSLFLHNYTLPIDRLYPKVEFPVSRGTPNISSLIKWDHHEDWFVVRFENLRAAKSGERKVTVSLEENPHISGHVIDGKTLMLNAKFETNSSELNRSMHIPRDRVLAARLGNVCDDHDRLHLLLVQH